VANSYQEIALEARKTVLRLIYKAQTSHIGSNFSCIDLMTVLFDKINLDKDKFVLSKGWVAASLYYFLWRKGRITEEELNSFCQDGSKFIGLAEPNVCKDIIIAGGSMSLGFPGAVGLAIAKKVKGESGKVYCLMSDGEMHGGLTWESAMIASHHHLDNLVVIIDNNGFCAMGDIKNVLNIEHLGDKWSSFGWDWNQHDGHDYEVIDAVLKKNSRKGIPYIFIANTTKGKGVSFMEGENLWHYAQIKEDDYNKALQELCQK